MVSTERTLGVVMAAGIVACAVMVLWPRGSVAPVQAAIESPRAAPVEAEAGYEELAPVEWAEPLPENLTAVTFVQQAVPVEVEAGLSRLMVQPQGLAATVTQPGTQFGVPVIFLNARAKPKLVADADGNGELSLDDRDQFESWWNDGSMQADLNKDGWVDTLDLAAFVDAFDSREELPQVAVVNGAFRVRNSRTLNISYRIEPGVVITPTDGN